MVDSDTPSLVDNIFTNNVTDPIAGNILEKISFDYLPNCVSFKLKNPRNSNTRIKTRDMNLLDNTKF